MANPAGDALTREQIQAVLRDAVDSHKAAWAYCPHCRKKVQADFPDHTARIKALQIALEHGYGKPGQAKDEERIDLGKPTDQLTQDERDARKRSIAKAYPDLAQPWLSTSTPKTAPTPTPAQASASASIPPLWWPHVHTRDPLSG